MKSYFFIFFCLILLILSQVYSQDKGKIIVKNDARLNELVDKHKQLNQKLNTMPGYRIQIYFESGANSKTLASNVKESFIAKFPEIKAYLLFHEPYYKVRVGDFRTRMEAQGFKQKIMAEYPISFVTKDDINFP
jgi:hypothetical protein